MVIYLLVHFGLYLFSLENLEETVHDNFMGTSRGCLC